MRVVMTGQIGMDKKHYLEAVEQIAGERGAPIEIYNVGDLMYLEAPDVRKGLLTPAPQPRTGSSC